MIAPASADLLAKVANGHADDLLSTLWLARDCALIVAPAMNRQMWANPATRRNVARLVADGVVVLGPGSGDQACGETGEGRMLEPEEIFAAADRVGEPKLLARGAQSCSPPDRPSRRSIPCAASRTRARARWATRSREPPRRPGRRSRSSPDPTHLPTPTDVTRIDVVSAAQMAAAVDANLDGVDMFIAVAAVADYTPDAPAKNKIKKGDAPLTIAMKPTVDILATVAARPGAPFCVGFAAETDDVDGNADAKRRRKKLPLIVANRAQDAFGSDDNEVTLLDDAGAHPLPRMGKLALARQLVAEIARRLPART